MTVGELATKLTEARANAPSGDKTLAIHLFGLRYTVELKRAGVEAVVKAADVPPRYGVELRKCMKLAEHVRLN